MLFDKLLIPYQDSIIIVAHSSVLFLRSDNCYTHVYLEDDRKFLVVKSLTKFEKEMADPVFIRVNQSFLINGNFITSINKKEKTVMLSNKHAIPCTITIKKLTSLITNGKVTE
jgi:DNA-binding LytR/AlgR family response regulator